MRWLIVGMCVALAGCDTTVSTTSPVPVATPQARSVRLAPDQARQSFRQVVRAVEPVAERECKRRTSAVNCDFKIVVDPNRKAPPNAYQSLDETGRPVITFTTALIGDTRNANELAFVLGHEAAHHIANHLSRQQGNALAGAVIFAGLTALTGGSTSNIQAAQELGAMVGARSYSKDFELEADQLGTIITYYAGYNPRVGAQFFARIPDPGDRFLGTHPPNSDRIETVRRTSAQLGLGG